MIKLRIRTKEFEGINQEERIKELVEIIKTLRWTKYKIVCGVGIDAILKRTDYDEEWLVDPLMNGCCVKIDDNILLLVEDLFDNNFKTLKVDI